MNTVVIVVGLFVVYKLLESQQASLAATLSSRISSGGGPVTSTPPVASAASSTALPSSGIVVGSSVNPYGTTTGSMIGTSSVDPTDSEVTQGLATASKATSAIPIVGQLTGLATSIASLFTASHQAAVAKEASTLNNAQPNFLTDVTQTMTALNQGAITPAQAMAYLQDAQDDYYATVSAIIKKGGPCRPPSDTSDPKGTTYCNIREEDWADCATAGPCNASCAIGCGMIEPTVSELTAMIQKGGGTFVVPPSLQNGAIQGTPSITITYTPYKAPSSSVGAVGSLLL